MDEQAQDGVMIMIGESVAFIPKEDLKRYRLNDEAAAEVLGQLEDAAEVSGFSLTPPMPNTGVLLGVQYKVGKPGQPGAVAPSSIMAHAMTVPRNN